jgi:predicted CopG family antitoxin
MSTKTIRISAKTYKTLTRLGTLGDTFDTVIKKLLAPYAKNTIKDELEDVE